MEEINSFSLQKKSDTDSELLYESAECSQRIAGLVLEKQYRLNNSYFLIITSDDCPFEEGLHLNLLDNRFKLLDSIEIGLPYTEAIFDNAGITSDNSMEFNFFPDTRYELTVDPSGQRFQFSKMLPEVSYHNRLFQKRYLIIKRIAKQDGY